MAQTDALHLPKKARGLHHGQRLVTCILVGEPRGDRAEMLHPNRLAALAKERSCNCPHLPLIVAESRCDHRAEMRRPLRLDTLAKEGASSSPDVPNCQFQSVSSLSHAACHHLSQVVTSVSSNDTHALSHGSVAFTRVAIRLMRRTVIIASGDFERHIAIHHRVNTSATE